MCWHLGLRVQRAKGAKAWAASKAAPAAGWRQNLGGTRTCLVERRCLRLSCWFGLAGLGRRVRIPESTAPNPTGRPLPHAGKATYIRLVVITLVIAGCFDAIHTLLWRLSLFLELLKGTPMKLYSFPVEEDTPPFVTKSPDALNKGLGTIRHAHTDWARRRMIMRCGQPSPRKSKAPTRRIQN